MTTEAGQVENWHGIFPAALTMFHRDGRLDEVATARHLELLLGEGADGLVVGGTSGEFIALQSAERRRLIEIAVETVADRVPVVAGTGYFSTAQTVALTREAEEIGADGAIVILPYYQRPMLGEVIRHFEVVGRSCALPVVAYNNPANSAAPALSPVDLARLYSDGVIAGVKSTFPTVHEIHELRAASDPAFRAFYGSFMAPLEGLAGGADGWISGILNVVTADAKEMATAIARSDLEAARAAWARILPIKQLYTERRLGPCSDLSIYRAILDIRGQHGGWSRPPTLPLTKSQRRQLEARMAD